MRINAKIFTSIACASLLATSVNANFTNSSGAGCNNGSSCTISGSQTGSVENDNNGSATLTIDKNATLTGEVENNGNLTINNSGEIKSSSNANPAISSTSQNANSPITINITNKKDAKIEGSGGIEFGNKTTRTSGEITLKNEGIIKGSDDFTDKGQQQDNREVDAYGLRVFGGTTLGSGAIHVKSVENSGTIESGQYGLNFVGNQGEITIDKIHNQQGGKILAKDKTYGHDGIHLGSKTTTKELKNDGEIDGKYGIWMADGAKVTKLENSGIISGDSRGIAVAGTSIIEVLSNIGNGVIKGGSGSNDAGIQVQKDGTIGKLIAKDSAKISSVANSGTINSIQALGNANITAIKNEVGAKIESITISNNAKVETITNKGAITTLTTTDKGSIDTLTNEKDATIDKLSLVGDLKSFTNNGTIREVESATGNLEQFINGGNITTFKNKTNIKGFTNKEQLENFVNEGVISGGITNEGSVKKLVNTGVITTNADGRHLENTTAGNTIEVEKWYVKSSQYISLADHNNLGSIKDDGDSRIVLGGAGASSVDFSKATLLIDAKHYQTNVYYDVGNTILVKNSPYRSAQATPMAIVDYGQTNTYNIIYDRATGKFIIDPRATAMAGGFFADYLINYLQRRNIAINQLVRYEEEKMRYSEEDIAHIFVIPYYAYDDFDLTSRAGEANIHTGGVMVGWHTFTEYGIFGGFGGYESSNGSIDIKDSNAYSDVSGDIDGFFAGLRYKAYLWDNGKHSVTWNNQAKFSHREADLEKNVNGVYFSDTPKVWNYAVDSTLNYDHRVTSSYGDSVLSFGAGLVYDGVRVENFKLSTKSQRRSENLYGMDLTMRFLHKKKNVSGVLEVGAHRLFNNTIKAYYGNDEDSFKIPRNYQFLQTGLVLDMSSNTYLGLNYSALFANNGTSHLGSLVFNIVW